MEAALRTANDLLTGKDNKDVEYKEVRGTAGLKEAVYNIAGIEVKVAVASGIENANYIMSRIKDGTADWHFIEIMCCPGGCVTGPRTGSVRNFVDLTSLRQSAIGRTRQ